MRAKYQNGIEYVISLRLYVATAAAVAVVFVIIVVQRSVNEYVNIILFFSKMCIRRVFFNALSIQHYNVIS